MKQFSVDTAKPVENPPGIVRRTLAYNEELMLCVFKLSAGAQIPLHNHRASQIGYCISGRVRFVGKSPSDTFEVCGGDSYVFDPHVFHGAEALVESEYVEVFHPMRPEYEDR
jgi:quercetin dioxygenase-like cupin family protein